MYSGTQARKNINQSYVRIPNADKSDFGSPLLIPIISCNNQSFFFPPLSNQLQVHQLAIRLLRQRNLLTSRNYRI